MPNLQLYKPKSCYFADTKMLTEMHFVMHFFKKCSSLIKIIWSFLQNGEAYAQRWAEHSNS